MAIAAVRYHHDERKVACSRERRAPQAGVSSSVASLNATPAVDDTKTTSSPGNLSATKLPIEVKALAGVITVLGLFIYFRIIAWRRRRTSAASKFITTNEKQWFTAHIDVESPIINVEKPSQAVLKPIILHSLTGVGWVPQTKPSITPPAPTRKHSQRVMKIWDKNLAKLMAPAVPEREPPPSYAPRAMSPIPDIPVSPPRHTLPPTPPTTLKLNFDNIPPPPQKPTGSPARSSSNGPHAALVPRLSASSCSSDRKLPRLMTVGNAFDPSMDDELRVTCGETIRLLEEYEDEWCLVQRVGRIDAEKGVIPRFCLVERPEVVPSYLGLSSAGSYRR